MKFKLKTLIPIMFSVLSACAILPYENDYSCRLKDNYGKCMSVDNAYRQAVSGQAQGQPLVPHSKQNRQAHMLEPTHNFATAPQALPYQDYRARTYQTLSRLIEQPRTAMLKPPTTIRTLILAYAPETQKETLYMPRYVYSIIDNPQWVLGQYLNKASTLTKSLVDNPELHP